MSRVVAPCRCAAAVAHRSSTHRSSSSSRTTHSLEIETPKTNRKSGRLRSEQKSSENERGLERVRRRSSSASRRSNCLAVSAGRSRAQESRTLVSGDAGDAGQDAAREKPGELTWESRRRRREGRRPRSSCISLDRRTPLFSSASGGYESAPYSRRHKDKLEAGPRERAARACQLRSS